MRGVPSRFRLLIGDLVTRIFPIETDFFFLRESIAERMSAVWLIHSQDWKWDRMQKNNAIKTHKESATHHSIPAFFPPPDRCKPPVSFTAHVSISAARDTEETCGNRSLVILASISLRWNAKSRIITRRLQVLRVLTALEGVSSPAVEVSRQEDVNARGAL